MGIVQVNAQEENTVNIEERTNMPYKDNGINTGSNGEKLVGVGMLSPQSPFYFLDIWFDNIKIRLSTNKDKTRLKVAKERLAELNTASTSNVGCGPQYRFQLFGSFGLPAQFTF